MLSSLKEAIQDSIDKLEEFLNRADTIRTFESYNLNDDYVFYISIYILATIILFIVCTLTNFYQIRTKQN